MLVDPASDCLDRFFLFGMLERLWWWAGSHRSCWWRYSKCAESVASVVTLLCFCGCDPTVSVPRIRPPPPRLSRGAFARCRSRGRVREPLWAAHRDGVLLRTMRRSAQEAILTNSASPWFTATKQASPWSPSSSSGEPFAAVASAYPPNTAGCGGQGVPLRSRLLQRSPATCPRSRCERLTDRPTNQRLSSVSSRSDPIPDSPSSGIENETDPPAALELYPPLSHEPPAAPPPRARPPPCVGPRCGSPQLSSAPVGSNCEVTVGRIRNGDQESISLGPY